MKAFHSFKPTMTKEEREIVEKINNSFSEHGLQILVEEQQNYSSNSHFHVFIVFDEKKNIGRREKPLPDAEEIRALMQAGRTADEIAAVLGVGRATLFRHLKKSETSHSGD